MASEALPPEMIFEILSRTSLETMERCEAASKCLKQIIYEPSFLFLHCKRSNCVFGYFFQTTINYRYQSALVSDDEGGAAAAAGINRAWSRGGPPAGINRIWPRDDTEILASCDQGILCCQRQKCHKKLRYYACKPATNQWQRLPNPKFRYKTASVAIVVVKSHPLRYNIVRLSEPRTGINYICEIFDSENRAWEKTQTPILPYFYFIKNPHDHPAVSVGQSIHWLITSNDNHDNLLTLDVSKRCFRCFPLPEPLQCNDAYIWKKLVKYEGGLGLTCLTADWKSMELWVAERGERDEWRRKMVVDMEFLEETLRSPKVVEFCNSDVVFMRTDDGAVFYNLRDRSFRKVKVPYNNHCRDSIQIFRFRSDLEMVDLDQRRPG